MPAEMNESSLAVFIFFLSLAVIAKVIRWALFFAVIITGGPKMTVSTPMPSVAVFFLSVFSHATSPS